jgi:methyl-accepting chemotaxis protein
MEQNMNIDCWDFKNCPSERKESCPAYTQKKGKDCWIVTGTMCGGVKQGSISEKIAKCHECNFYKMRCGIRG